MTTDLRCYGDDIQALADLVPDFDLRSPMDVESWYPREWQAIADTLGFAQQLAAAPRAMPTTPDRITAMTLVGLMAFEHALRAGRPGVPESQARVQSAVIQAMTATGLERGELWRAMVDPTTLATGACYVEGGRSLRAFYPDTAPGYFGDGWSGPPPRAESACGWQTPLVLHLGTFPWVYSSRLGDRPRRTVGLVRVAAGAGGPPRRRKPAGARDESSPGRAPGRRDLPALRHAHRPAGRRPPELPARPGRGRPPVSARSLPPRAPGQPPRRGPGRPTRPPGGIRLQLHPAALRQLLRRPPRCPPGPGDPSLRGPATRRDLGRSLPAPASRGGGPCELSPSWTRRAVPRCPILRACAAPRS